MTMKKIFNSILVIAAAAAVFASCQKNEVVPSTTKTVNFTATTVDTKAAFGTPDGTSYPTLWTSNDSKVKVSLNYATPVDANVTPASDGKSATFSGEFKDDESGNYIFTAISPATAYYAVSSEKEDWTISIPTSQTPSATSVDEAAMILSAATATTDMTETIDLAFQHVTAYGVFNLTNINLGGAVISSITLTAEKPLAGRFYSYPASGDIEVNSGVNAITINTSTTENIWFACAPCDLGGTTLKVAVITDKGTYIKNASIPTGAFKFEAGVIGKFNIDMTGIAPDSGLAEGKYAILAKRETGNYFFMTNDLGTAATKRFQAVDSKLSVLPETISTKPDNVWTVTKSGNGYIIANQVGKQVSWSSGNSAFLEENGKVLTAVASDVEGAFNLSFEPGGSAKTRNLALNINASSNWFAFYENTTQVIDLFFVPATIVEPTYYDITVAETTNGTVEASKDKAEAGETITVTVTPDTGYKLATLTFNGNDIKEAKSFVMPAEDVTISATFVQSEGNEPKTWTYEVDQNSPALSAGNPVTVNDATWSIVMGDKVGAPTTNGAATKYSGIYGWKWGDSSSKYWKSYTISTDYFASKKVKSVKVNILNNGSKTGTLVVTQGSKEIGSASATFGQTWTDLTANTTQGEGGTLSIAYTVAQASYIHSITVEYLD